MADTDFDSRSSSNIPLIALGALSAILAALTAYFALQNSEAQHLLTQEKNRAESAQPKIDQLTSRIASAESQTASGRELAAAREKEVQALKAELARMRDEKLALESGKQESDMARMELMEKLKQHISTPDIRIDPITNDVKVTVADRIFFASGSAELLPGGQKILDQIASYILPQEQKIVRIYGHTDDVPIHHVLKKVFASNWELSAKRATTAVRYLVQEVRFPANRLYAIGCGDTQPAVPNSSEENRSKNRRIEIVVATRPSDAPATSQPAAQPAPEPTVIVMPAPAPKLSVPTKESDLPSP